MTVVKSGNFLLGEGNIWYNINRFYGDFSSWEVAGMYCKVCGHNARDGAAFCDVCGAPLDQAKKINPEASTASGQEPLGQSGTHQPMYQQTGPAYVQGSQTGSLHPQGNQTAGLSYVQGSQQTGSSYAQGKQQAGSSYQQGNYQSNSIYPQGQTGSPYPQRNMQTGPIQNSSGGSKLALIIAIVAGVVVLGTVCILLFVTPGFLRRTKDADKTSYQSGTESKREELTSGSSADATSDTEAVTESTSEKTEAAKSEVTTEAVTEMSAEDQKKALLAEAAKLSTSERPNIAQFFWYTEGVRWDGIPAGVETISQRELLEGDWMMYMVTDPYYKSNSYSERYLNANIHLEDDGSSVVIVLDWWTMTYDKGTVDEEQYGDEKFTGSYDVSNHMVTQSSSYNSLILTDYWKRGRNQFITGTFTWNDGEEGLVALVRPGESIEYEQSDNIYDYSKNAPDYSTFEPETEATTEAKTEAPKQTNAISDEEILRRACQFTGAPYAEIESIDPGTGYYNIHCYDLIDDGGGYSHVNTYNWLTIDPVTLTGHDISGDPVSLN